CGRGEVRPAGPGGGVQLRRPPSRRPQPRHKPRDGRERPNHPGRDALARPPSLPGSGRRGHDRRAVPAAYLGTALVHHVSEHLLERIILVFLVVIGTALIVEAFLPRDVPALLPDSPLVRLVAAVIIGLGIGLVSSLLGVAGGEIII